MFQMKTFNRAGILVIFSVVDITQNAQNMLKLYKCSRKFKTYASQRDSSVVQVDEQPPVVVVVVVDDVVQVVNGNSFP